MPRRGTTLGTGYSNREAFTQKAPVRNYRIWSRLCRLYSDRPGWNRHWRHSGEGQCIVL